MDTFKKKKKKEQYSIDTLLTGNRERSASVFDEEERKRRIQHVKERAAQTREAIDDVRERYSSRVSMDGRRSAGITDEERQRRIDRVKSVSANTGSFVTPGTRRDTESSDGGLFSRRNGDFGGFSISSLLSSIADRGADNQLKVENNDSERQRRLERTKQYKTPQEKKEEERAAADSVPVTTTENTEKTKAVKDTEKDNKDTTPSQTLPTPKAGTAPTLVPPSEPAQTPQVGRTPAPAASDLPMGVKPKVVASSGAIPVEQSLEVPYKEEQPATMLEMDSDKPLYIREREAQKKAAADIEKQQHQLGNTGYKETLNPDSPMYDEETGAELAQKAADDEFHNAAKRRDDYNQQQKKKQDEWLDVAEPEKPAEPVETLYDTTGDKPPVVKHREAAEKAELAGVEPLDVSVSTLGKNTNAYSRKLLDRPNYTPEQKLFMASKVVERTSDVVDEHFYTASERKADEENRLNRRTDEFKALDLNVLKLLDKASDPDGEEYQKLLEMGYGENDIKDFRRLYKRYGLTYFYESRYSTLSESELALLGEMYTASINLEYADEYTSSKQIDSDRKKYLEGSGYFYDKGYSQQELLVFLDMYGRNKNEHAMNELATSVETLADEHPVLGTVGRVGAGLISPIFSTAGSLDNYGKVAANRMVGYKPELDANNPLYFLDKSVAAYDQRMIENLGEDTVGATAYKVGTNVTDNLLPALIGGSYVGAGYNALRAFNSAVISGSEKGLNPEQVLVDGLVTAGLEFAFEKVSLSNASFMQKSTGVKSIKTFLSDLGKDFIGAGSEEALTEIANIVYDTVVHGDKSDYQYLVNYYMSEGMSLENARIQAARDLGKQVIESGVLGGISGGVTSVGNSAYGAAAERTSDYYIGKEIKKSGMQGEVIKNAKATPETTAAHKKATKLEKQLSAGKNVSNTGLAKALRGTAEYTGGKDVQAVGQFEGAESSAELEKMYQNELGKITEEVELGFMKPGTAESKIEALENDYQKSKIAMSERFARSEYIRDVKTSLSEAQQFEIKHPDIKTDSGTATVNKIVDIKDGKFTVETTEKTGRRTEVITPDSVVDQTARELMEVAKNMTVETAQKFMEGYKGGEVNRYKESWDYYSNMGRANVDFEKAQRLDGVYYNYISAEAAQAAIKSGFNDREFTVGVTDLSTTKKTYQERMMFRVMEGFAKEFGTEFIVVDDLDNANGYFIGDTNRIVISRNAEGGMLLRTAGHEAYHFIESNSAESAQALGDFVIDSLKKNGMDIEAQAAKLRRRYSADGAVSDAQIRAEIVADSMFEVLNSKEAINRFVRKNNPKKVQSVIDAIEKIVNSIKTSLARMGQKLDGSGKYVHPEIKALVDDYEALEEIRKQFMKGMESASASFEEKKNKKSAEKAADGNRYSIKLEEYLNAGERRNKKKAEAIANGIKILLNNSLELKEYINKAINKKVENVTVAYGKVNKRCVSDVKEISNGKIDVTDYFLELVPSDLEHAWQEHHKAKESGDIPLSQKDFENIPNYFENYDEMVYAIQFASGNKKLCVSKKIKDGRMVIVEVVSKSRGSLQFKNAIGMTEEKYQKIFLPKYKRSSSSSRGSDSSNTSLHNDTASNTRIAQKDSSVNTEFMQGSQNNSDIKKSLKAEDDAPTAIDRYYAEAIRENRAFSQIFALMGDMYSTKMGEVYLDNADIRALSKKLLKEFGSKYDEAALTDELQIVFDYMANNRGNIDVDGCMKIFMQSAQNILENSEMKNDELWQHHADTREFLREQRIYITPELKTEIESAYGDYKSFRSRLMGKMMHISTKDSGAATLDEVWGELNERAPEYFPKEVNDKDQPLYLTKFFESIAPKTVNRVDHYSLDMETESAILAARMFEEFGNIGRLKTTEQKIADLYRTKQFKLKSETQALRRKLKADAEKHKADTVEDYRKQLGDYRTAREMTEKRRRLRNEIDRSVAYVNRRLERETDKDHIPEKLKPLTRSFLRALPDNGEYFNPDRFASFVQEYDKLKSDFAEDDFEYMKARMNEFFDNVAGRSEAQPPKRRELDDVQLATLRDIAAHVKYIVQNENRMFNENIKETAQQLSQKAHSELTAKGKSSVQGVPEHASKLSREAIRNRFDSFARKLVKPDYLFANLGSDTLEMLYKEMHKGENVESEMIRQAKTDLDEIRRRNNYDTRWKYQTVTVKSRDGELTITVEDAMALYATCKRNQGLGHILNGGFEIEFKTKKGWVKDRRVFTPDDIRLLKDSLSKDQLNYMNETVEYITKVIGGKRNETSMRMLGIKKYNEEFYFPIKTHENFNDTSVGVKKGVAKIENQSSAKRTTKNADNPVVIRGFSDTVVDHVFDSAMYCAYAAAIKDFARVYNYREKNEIEQREISTKELKQYADAQKEFADDMGFYAERLEVYTDSRYSIKEDVQRANGVNAIKEVEAFLQALDSGSMDKSALSLPAKFASKAKKAAVMANVSVVVQQPTSVFRAMLHVSPKYFATFATKADIEEMKKYNPGCTFKKEIGYFDINVGSTATDYMKEHTVDKAVKKDWGARDRARNLAEKALPKIDEVSGWAASKADEMTWGAIWNACKKQTAAQNSDLSPEQVKSKAAELFQEVISKTQVYDSVFTKNAAMRSKSGFDIMIMQFMSEPMTTLNMLADAVVNAKNGRQPKSRCAAAFACYITSLVANSAVKSLVYSLRDDDEEKSFVEKFIGNFAEGAITDPFGMIPYLKEVLSLVQGYDFERIDTKALEELLNAYQSVINDDKTPWDKVMAVMKAVGYATGVPFHTVMRDGKAVVEAGKKVYDAVANGKALEPTTGEGIKQTLAETFDWVPGVNPANKYEQLYNALIEGDTAHYNKVYNNLIEDGKEESTINNGIAGVLAENEPKIQAAYEAKINGDLSQMLEYINDVSSLGISDDTVAAAVNRYESSLVSKLKKEDPRITEAAKALDDNQKDKYKKIREEIIAEGIYDVAVIDKAISGEREPKESNTFENVKAEALAESKEIEELYNAVSSGEMSKVSKSLDDISSLGVPKDMVVTALNRYENSLVSELKKEDPRISEAAKALDKKQNGKYKQIRQEIIDEGNYDVAVIDKAISGERESGESSSYEDIEINALAESEEIEGYYNAIRSGNAEDIEKSRQNLAKAGYSDTTKNGEAIVENKEKIKKALAMYENSLIKEAETEEDVIRAAEARYNMEYDEYDRLYNKLVNEGRYDENIIQSAIDNVDEDLPKTFDEFAAADPDHYAKTYDLKNAVINGDDEKIDDVIANYEVEHGSEAAAKDIRSVIKSAYKDELISEERTEELLTRYAEEGTTTDDIWFEMEKLRTGSSSDYGSLYGAFENDGDIYSEMDKLTAHGKEPKSIRQAITTKYKPKYLAGEFTKEELVELYMATGMDRAEASAKIDKWE